MWTKLLTSLYLLPYTCSVQEAPYNEIRVGRGPAFELRTEDLPGVAQTIDEEGE